MRKLLFVSLLALAAAALVGSTAYGSPQSTKKVGVTIIHVQKGCHVFADASGKGARRKLAIARGGTLKILNQDIDGHKLVQLRGPAKMRLAALKMNGHTMLRFKRRGVYVFTTKSFEVEGMPEAKTMGMDNMLRLTVVVS